MTYKVKLDVFEGPLDLLLYLVTKEQLDITAISLAKVADEYFAYLKMLPLMAEGAEGGLDLNVESEYLVVFACLLELKSRVLLPPEPEETDFDDLDLERDTEEHDLLERLKEYKRFKEASVALQNRERESLQMFARPAPAEGETDAFTPAFDVALPDLLNALRTLLENRERRKAANKKLRLQRVAVSVPQRMNEILRWLSSAGNVGHQVEFFELFDDEVTRPQIIVTFLAILELARLRRIRVWQERADDGRRGPLRVELLDTNLATHESMNGTRANEADSKQ